jgi:phosphoribosylformimino-5-aminoimidazole carboxamide ribotide isomerase
MNIIPSVDLLDGRVVRLHKGDYNKVTVYHSDPLAQLQLYIDAGFERIHVVDLNGAKDGTPKHLDLLRPLILNRKLCIHYGGGIRTEDHLKALFNAGVCQAVVTSMAVKQPDAWAKVVAAFGADRFICGLDLKDGKVAYSGWTETASQDTDAFIRTQIDLGLTAFLCTDISKDGTLSGANATLYATLIHKYPGVKWIASGGFKGMDDIVPLRTAGCWGAIVGKAYYERYITLEQMRAAHEAI